MRNRREAEEAAAERVWAGMCQVQRDGNPLRQHGIAFRHLGKLNPIGRGHLEDLRLCFSPLVQMLVPCQRSLPDQTCTVLGLSESGIIPSYAVHSLLGESAEWHCTTRQAIAGALSFQESHSHAPTHYLPQAFHVEAPRDLWVVEDEITTGKTLLNLLACLPRSFGATSVRILALLDGRDVSAKSHFLRRCQEFVAEGRVASVQCWAAFESPEACRAIQPTPTIEGRPAVNHEKSGVAQPGTDLLPALAVGEAIQDGLGWLDADGKRRMQHVSLSPWCLDGRFVHQRQSYGAYHLYNWCYDSEPVEASWIGTLPAEFAEQNLELSG